MRTQKGLEKEGGGAGGEGKNLSSKGFSFTPCRQGAAQKDGLFISHLLEQRQNKKEVGYG